MHRQLLMADAPHSESSRASGFTASSEPAQSSEPSSSRSGSTAEGGSPSHFGRSARDKSAPARSELLDVEQKVVKWWHPLAMVLVIAGLFVLFDSTGMGSDLRRGDLAEIRHWIEGFGVLAPIVFLSIYVVATMVGFPSSPLTFTAGAMFGALPGFILATIASQLTVTSAFLVSRRFANVPVNRWLGKNRRFQQLNRLTQRHDVLVVLTVRLVNILPFFLVNYGFGVTKVSFGRYVLWSFIGKIPGTIVLVLIGDAIYQSVLKGDVPWAMVTCVLVLLGTLAVILHQLNRRLAQGDSAGLGDGDSEETLGVGER